MKTVLASLIYVFLSCIMLYLSKVLFNKFSIFNIEEEVKRRNATAIISFAGYILGVAIILCGAYLGPSLQSFKADLVFYLAYAVLGISLMSLSGVITDKIMLNRFDCKKEILEDFNIGTGFVYFGFYIATGLIISSCITGEVGGIVSSLAYYVLDMFFISLFLKVYDKITPYSIHKELEQDNYAVGISLAGNIIAIGIILMKATLGDSSSAGILQNAILYFADLAAIFLLLPGIRFILGNVIVRGINLNAEIKENNCAAALIEFISIICFALILFFMIDFCAVV